MIKFWILCCCIISAVYLSGAQAGDENSIIGSFELTSDPKAEDRAQYHKALGYDEAGREARRGWNAFEMSKDGDKWTYKIKFANGRDPLVQEFESGKEFEEDILQEKKVKTTILIEECKLTRTVKGETFEAVEVLQFTEEGATFTMTTGDVTAVLTFKRVK